LNLTCVVDSKTTRPYLKGEHGLAIWIESADGVVLYDTGQTADVLCNNLKRLNLPLDQLTAVVLSHAHYDHTGGLPALLQERPGLPVYAHPDLFRPRYSHLLMKHRFIGLGLVREELMRQADVHLSNEPVEILPGLWTTGEITTRDEALGTSSRLCIKGDDGSWQPDPHRDDLSLVWRGKEGLTLICGCCHAGILNTLDHVQRVFNDRIVNIFGGIHLKDANNEERTRVVNVLREKYTDIRLYLNHCTGDAVIQELAGAFQGCVMRFPVGMAKIVE